MKGSELVKQVEQELLAAGISKTEFYRATGISSATFSQWRTDQVEPSIANYKKIESFFQTYFDKKIERERVEDQEVEVLKNMLRNRQDLRVLLRSAHDVPPSSVYALISQIEKEKENDASD